MILASCAMEKHERPPLNVEIPANWSSKSTPVKEYINLSWGKKFNDPKLTSLINEVLKNNYDLQIAASNLEKAKAQAKKTGADLIPQIDLNSQIGRNGNLKNGKDDVNQLRVSFDVSWEADVWGRIRSRKNATTDDYYAAESDYKAANQSLSAQAAKAYFLSIEAKKQLELAQEFQKSLQITLKVTEAFHKEGLISLQDVHVAKSALDRAAETVQNKKSENLSALRSLEILLGRYPNAALEIGGNFPKMPDTVASGIPSGVLERRPDIVAGERRVSAAFNRTNESRAAKLPTLSLTGSMGASSSDLTTLTDPTNLIWNVAGGLLFPIFNAGGLNAAIDIKTAKQKSAIINYQKAALTAFSEVESALSNESIYRARQKNLNDAYQNSLIAETIADESFKAGTIDLLDLLQIKRTTITTKGDMLRSQRELLDQRVNLQLALGGGEV